MLSVPRVYVLGPLQLRRLIDGSTNGEASAKRPQGHMLIGTIDFPPEVVDGQRDGQLVVFAGAGVSMPPPSNLPSFSDLAAQIGEGCNPRNSSESPDEYLGRLHNLGEGVAVHQLAAKSLLNPESKP